MLPPLPLLLPFAISFLLLPFSSSACWKPPEQWNPTDGIIDEFLNLPEYGGTLRQIGLYDSNNTFALGFFNTTPNQFTLSLAMNIDNMGTTQPAVRIVWSANRNDPASINATLMFQTDGNLILRDGNNGTVLWSTNTSNKGVTCLDVLPTGNFVLLNGSNIPVWQSFNHPTDTILVDQILNPGMKLISRVSDSDPSEGMYAMVVHPGGLALYASSPDPQPYWFWSYYGINDSLSVMHACKNPISVTLWVASDVYLQMSLTNASLTPDDKQDSLCTSAPSSDSLNYLLVNGREGHTQSFLRLDSDGVLRVYSLAQLGIWNIPFQLYQGSAQSCLLPQKCAPFGICGNDGGCNGCPLVDGSIGQWLNCSLPKLPSCQNGTATNANPDSSLQFSKFIGMDYFSNMVDASQMVSTTIEECENRCLHNCSCVAFFYWNNSGFCFLAERLATLQQVSNTDHLAFIKIPANPKSQGKSGNSQTHIISPANPKSQGKSGNSQTLIISIVSSSLITIALLLCILVYAYRKAKSRRNDATDEDSLLGTLHESTLVRFKYKELQLITNDFRDVLGRGGFGIVYEGVLSSRRKVAVKRLESKSSQGWKEFKAEITTLGAIHHWNLVQLLGFCADGDHRLLVYEFLSNGSLDSWLFNEAVPPLSWKLRSEIALGAARGLAYLHEECKERIIHLDVKPQNILLDDAFVAKVADFGLSRLMRRDESFVVTTMRGTPGYLAPEWLLESAVTEKADVYSFGMVLLEIVGGRRNLMHCVADSEKRYFPSWALRKLQEGKEMELLDERLQEAAAADSSSIDEDEAKRMISIVFLCIQEEVGLRPSMSKVVKMLEGSMAVPKPAIDQALQFSLKSRARAIVEEEKVESSAFHGGGVMFSSVDPASAR